LAQTTQAGEVASWHGACFDTVDERMMRRIGLLASLWAPLFALLVSASGCITPTLPPDDPPEPEVELGVGVARLRGHVGAGPAFVLVHNRVSGLVFGERAPTGAYDFEVRTEPCDVLALWYTMGSFQSPTITFRPAELEGPRGSCSGAAADAPEGDAGGDP
jgi:hypothetical protein